MSDETPRYLHTLECLSCGNEFQRGVDQGVPIGIECCRRCWSKVPVVDRLKLQMAIRDRQPGGFLSEIANLVERGIHHFNESEGKDFGSDHDDDH